MIEGNDFSEPILQIIKSVRAQFLSHDMVHPSIPPGFRICAEQPRPTWNNSEGEQTSSHPIWGGKLKWSLFQITCHLKSFQSRQSFYGLCFFLNEVSQVILFEAVIHACHSMETVFRRLPRWRSFESNSPWTRRRKGKQILPISILWVWGRRGRLLRKLPPSSLGLGVGAQWLWYEKSRLLICS